MDPQPDDIISLQREKGSGDNAGRLRTPRNHLIPGVVNEHKPTNEEKVPATIISNLLKPSTDSVSGQADHSVDLPRGATEDSPFIQDTSPSIPNGPPEVTTGGSQSSQYGNCWWYLEILGIVASIAAMVLVVITLHLVQDKPLHGWTFFFQPNTVLSALVTAAKSTMLFSIAECLGQLKWIYYWHCKEKRRLQTLEVFDGASRGPWGAVKFYFSIRSYVPIGAMASFVTILTLGMDPFTQQIISFQTRFVDAPGEIATIPISNKFNVKHTVSQQYTNSRFK
ncbi:hypothetical protein SLS56_002870 [Neofusicoccum ribis]|uniref:Uncharacterized protein n=1 Tax=Neofusicoccum ribis TaxID=45134 RepID=A0ABR3T1Q6_9PEZI